MKLRTIDVTILLVLGLLCITRATWGIFKDINVNLTSANLVKGTVVNSDIIQIEKVTFKSKKYKTVFAFRLENSNEEFAVDRGVGVCNYLNSEIERGDTLIVYYRQSTNEYNTFVFQIENGQKVLANFKDYKTGETEMIVLLYAFGFLIIGGLTVWYYIKKQDAKLTQT